MATKRGTTRWPQVKTPRTVAPSVGLRQAAIQPSERPKKHYRRKIAKRLVVMKLALCEHCWDLFKLDYVMRQCRCGRVKGRYVDDLHAEVSPTAVSIALGNGSVQQAIRAMRKSEGAGDYDIDPRERGVDKLPGKIQYAWVRPNTGPGNPHTSLIKEEGEK